MAIDRKDCGFNVPILLLPIMKQQVVVVTDGKYVGFSKKNASPVNSVTQQA